jgi:hypothetical protein
VRFETKIKIYALSTKNTFSIKTKGCRIAALHIVIPQWFFPGFTGGEPFGGVQCGSPEIFISTFSQMPEA